MLRDNLGRPPSAEAEFLASWVETWIMAEEAKGAPFEDTRARLNAAFPMLLSLLHARDAALAAEASLDRIAS
jgi:hypothetical protein